MSTNNKEEDLLNDFFDRSITSSDDEFSVCMFCTIIKNNPNLVPKATNLIANKINSDNLEHSLRSMQILEECMSKSGEEFQNEIAKYRFLNILIKYLLPENIKQTPQELRNKILDCFLLWTVQYPDKEKICLAYEMLCKQDVVSTSVPTNNLKTDNTHNRRAQSFMNTENEQKLKKLLQSNKPDDLKRANLFIQFHVNQDSKKLERKYNQKAELNKFENTANLLIEVLNSYATVNEMKKNDSLLLNDLYELCEKNKSVIDKMPNIMEDSEAELINEIFRVNNILLTAIQKYDNFFKAVMTTSNLERKADETKITNLRLDEILSSSFTEQNLIETQYVSDVKNSSDKSDEDGLAELNDIFKNLPTIKSNEYDILLKPMAIDEKETYVAEEKYEKNTENNKVDLLSTIDKISEELFQESLKSNERAKSFAKESEKRTLNELGAKNKHSSNNSYDDPLTSIFKPKSSSLEEIKQLIFTESNQTYNSNRSPEKVNTHLNGTTKPLKHLSEIHIDLNDVIPSNRQPTILLDDARGLRIILNFTENKPDTDIFVIVISTINQNSLNIKDFRLEASVPLPSKLFLLPPTGTSLSGIKPFRPPSDLQQILLLYNPTKQPVNITCILSYILGDDPDPIKESIVAKNI